MDSQTGPLITADGSGSNGAGISTDSVAQGSVGTLAKIPVYVDPGVSTTANSTTNQDEAYTLRASDLYLWESDLRMEAFEQPFADSAAGALQVHGLLGIHPGSLFRQRGERERHRRGRPDTQVRLRAADVACQGARPRSGHSLGWAMSTALSGFCVQTARTCGVAA